MGRTERVVGAVHERFAGFLVPGKHAMFARARWSVRARRYRPRPSTPPTLHAVDGQNYRMHRLRSGDEWVLGTLARGNARFADGNENDWQPPLGSDEASRFVADPLTVCIVAIDTETNHIAGFVYGGVLSRRHTKLQHICLYEIGIDIDHRDKGVGPKLLEAFSAEARQMGIDKGFVILNESDRAAVALFEAHGAMRGDGRDALFGLSF